MGVDEYISKANQQLTEGNVYKKLNEDSNSEDSDIVNNTTRILKRQELLPISTAKKITKNNAWKPQFHIFTQTT